MYCGPGRAGHRIAFAVAAGLMLLGPVHARADAPSVSIATGQYGFRKEVPHGLGIELQVRPPWFWYLIRPTVGVLTSSNGEGAYVFTGFVIEVPLPLGLQLSPGFAPGVMLAKDNSGHLGFPIEFRSSIELSYAMRSEARVGISFMHISNARLSDHNPGVEALLLGFTFPGTR